MNQSPGHMLLRAAANSGAKTHMQSAPEQVLYDCLCAHHRWHSMDGACEHHKAILVAAAGGSITC